MDLAEIIRKARGSTGTVSRIDTSKGVSKVIRGEEVEVGEVTTPLQSVKPSGSSSSVRQSIVQEAKPIFSPENFRISQGISIDRPKAQEVKVIQDKGRVLGFEDTKGQVSVSVPSGTTAKQIKDAANQRDIFIEPTKPDPVPLLNKQVPLSDQQRKNLLERIGGRESRPSDITQKAQQKASKSATKVVKSVSSILFSKEFLRGGGSGFTSEGKTFVKPITDVGRGIVKEVEQKPIQTVGTFLVGAGLGTATVAGSRLLQGSKFLKAIPKSVVSKTPKVIGGLATGLYAGVTGLNILNAPKGKKTEQVGREITKGVAFFGGAATAIKGIQKIDSTRILTKTTVEQGSVSRIKLKKGAIDISDFKLSASITQKPLFSKPITTIYRGVGKDISVLRKGGSLTTRPGISIERSGLKFDTLKGVSKVQLTSPKGKTIMIEGAFSGRGADITHNLYGSSAKFRTVSKIGNKISKQTGLVQSVTTKKPIVKVGVEETRPVFGRTIVKGKEVDLFASLVKRIGTVKEQGGLNKEFFKFVGKREGGKVKLGNIRKQFSSKIIKPGKGRLPSNKQLNKLFDLKGLGKKGQVSSSGSGQFTLTKTELSGKVTGFGGQISKQIGRTIVKGITPPKPIKLTSVIPVNLIRLGGSRSKTKSKVKQIQVSKIVSSIKPIQPIKFTPPKTIAAVKQIDIVKQIQIPGQSTKSKQRQRTKQAQKPRLIQSPRTITPPSKITSPFLSTPRTLIPGFIPPKLPIFLGGGGGGTLMGKPAKKNKRLLGYKPSLVGLEFKLPRVKSKILTGIEVRGI